MDDFQQWMEGMTDSGAGNQWSEADVAVFNCPPKLETNKESRLKALVKNAMPGPQRDLFDD